MDIHVIGQVPDDIDDEIITLEDSNGNPEMIVCAVPFLRDRDVRTANSDEDLKSRQEALISGICSHYKKVFDRALEIMGDLKIPLIATGHLFIDGATDKGEEHRELYVGTAIRIDLKKTGIFPPFVNYVALGHLHAAHGSSRIRYSGSPFPMTFGEANKPKHVTIVEFDENSFKAKHREIEIPVFKKLLRLKGDWNTIENKLDELTKYDEPAWLEVTYTGEELIDIQERINTKLKLFPEIEVLSLYDEAREKLNAYDSDEVIVNESKNLDEILPEEIFKLKMKANKIPEEQQEVFLNMYREVLDEINN